MGVRKLRVIADETFVFQNLKQRVKGVARSLFRAQGRANLASEWRRRLGGAPQLPPGRLSRVLFLCQGNICRSPFAALLLKQHMNTLEVCSRGLRAGRGTSSPVLAQEWAQHFAVDLSAHRSAPLCADDVAWADLILAMEGWHADLLRRDWPEALHKLRLLGDFLVAPPFTLEDPWGRDTVVFGQVFTRTARAVECLAAQLREREQGEE